MAEQAQNLTAILDRIAHLKALEERPGTPEEAAAATAAIQRLMYRYNLDQVQVDAAQRGTSGAYGRVMLDMGSLAPWRRTLLSGVCHYNFTKSVFSGLFSSIVSLIGQKHNIAVTTGLFDYLQSTIERLAREEYADTPTFVRKPLTDFCFAFGVGATESVLDRLREQWLASQASGNDETALVLLDDDLQNAMNDFYPGFSYLDNEAMVDAMAFTKGQEAGKAINLAKQVEG